MSKPWRDGVPLWNSVYDADGRRLVQVACPHCEHRHWLPDAATGFCSRRNSTFHIPTESSHA